MLAAGPGYTGGIGSGGSDRDAQIARMLELANRPESMGSQPMFRVEVNGVGSTGMDDRTPTTGGYLPSMYPDPQLVGSGVNAQGLRYFDYDTDARSIQVRDQSVLTAQALAPLPANAAELSASASDRRFYNDQIANATNPWSAIGYSYLRALNGAGHDIADGVKGIYTLATDANARARLIGAGINAVSHPIDTATGLYNAGANYLRTASVGQMGEDGLRLLAGGLATAGAGKGAVMLGDTAGTAAMSTGKWLAPKAAEMVDSFAYRSGMRLSMVEPGPSFASAEVQLSATRLRNTPGIATAGSDLAPVSGRWLDAGVATPIPSQVGEALMGQSYSTFGDLRQAIWEQIGGNPELNSAFTPRNIAQMRDGYAPIAPPQYVNESGMFGDSFNIHHATPIENGGAVYDLSNLRIVSPKVHYETHYGKK